MVKSEKVYLDYMATTPCLPEVVEQLKTCLSVDGDFANSGSLHGFGLEANLRLNQASADFACCIGAAPTEIIWTSGATESNNLALRGAVAAYPHKGRHIITVASEHKAVLSVCVQLAELGYEVDYLKPGADGLLDLDQLAAKCRRDTVLVSVMHVNNETGVIQDIGAIANIVKKCGALFHVDAAQSLGKVAIDLASWPVDLMSFSGHKCYAPKGIGALYVRGKPRVRLVPQIIGGGQQHGLRSGTMPVALIVAMAAATTIATSQLERDNKRLWVLNHRLWQGIQALGQVSLNGSAQQRVPHNLNISFTGIDGEAMLYALGQRIACASGSACNAATRIPSHVLTAMGQDDLQASSAIRMSMGLQTGEQDIEMALDWMRQQVSRMRRVML